MFRVRQLLRVRDLHALGGDGIVHPAREDPYAGDAAARQTDGRADERAGQRQRHDAAQQIDQYERREIDDLPQAARSHDRCGVLLGAQQTAARQQGVAGGDEQAESQSGRAAEQILSGRHVLSLPFVQPR